jgi:hypothetical protein
MRGKKSDSNADRLIPPPPEILSLSLLFQTIERAVAFNKKRVFKDQTY